MVSFTCCSRLRCCKLLVASSVLTHESVPIASMISVTGEMREYRHLLPAP